ncbi:uncharacterized protein [Parasteatoda tepidariorum]|uniref:uncharacterized protein n=1 Tax=Parasteatoda tepidariorum TaxID=114398 RepID=UPI00077FD1AC|nr:uncharacterized protein LOC107451710 [Parasteatoda tepidariorum]
MRCVVLILLVVTYGTQGETVESSPCKSWEFRCSNDHCISHNRYCDGTDDCGDSSDEPPGCTNCNQTLMGEVGTKYPLRITEPFHRNSPFVCKLHLVAGGGDLLGERLEITFLSFQIGSLTLDRNGSEDKLECKRGYLRLSESHDDIFLGDDGFRKPGSTLRSQQTRGFSQLISAFKEPPLRQLSTLYELTANMEPDFGLFCGSLISSNLGVAFYSSGNNVTLSVYLPPRSAVGATSLMGSFGLYLTYRFLSSNPPKASQNTDHDGPTMHLGNEVANTYCDKAFANCDRKKCIIRSPNFPGLYLRNFTCNYYIRQDYIPPGKRAHIVIYQSNEYKISVNTGSSLIRSDSRKLINQGIGGLSTDCAGDVVRIYDRINSEDGGGRALLTEFCESGSLTDVVSSGPEMLVQLYSAPSNLLYESRLELEVRVEFSEIRKMENEFSSNRDGKCEIVIDGSVTRTGVIKSPQHNMPKNTTCEAKLIGTSSQRIWLYFVSYFVQDQGTLGFDHHPSSTEFQSNALTEDTCDISSLELYLRDSHNKSFSKTSHEKSMNNSTYFRFCESTLPVMCTRASDFIDFIPKRPCLPPNESYFSESSKVLIRYSLSMRAPNVVSSLSATSFIIRYEFVDVEPSEKPQRFDATAGRSCGRFINSSVNLSGEIFSPRNLFLYGRGGQEKLTCDYHFSLQAKERILIEVGHFHSNIRTCSTSFDPRLQRFDCYFKGGISSHQSYSENTIPHRHSFLSFTESFGSSSVHVGCICDRAISLAPSIMFTSSSSEQSSAITMTFDVSGMTAFEDYSNFSFSVRYRILPSSSNDQECSVLPDKLDRNRTHGGELSFQAAPSSSNMVGEHLLRCRWFLQSSLPETYLYLQLRGKPCDNPLWLEERNRVILYSSESNGLMYPKMVLCLSSFPSESVSSKSESEIFDFFSTSWYKNDTNNSQFFIKDESISSNSYQERNQSIPDKIIVELMAFRKGTLTVKWLEVSKPSSKPVTDEVHSDGGRTLKNINCLHECPELSACINPELWCDGVVHCPHSGFDESAENCQQTLTLYISVGLGCLVVFMGVGLLIFFLFRKYSQQRRLHQQTHPASFEHLPHCLQHNQNRELTTKNFSNASPVFMVGGSMKKKKKKNKDEFLRHIQTMEVRFPDLHM